MTLGLKLKVITRLSNGENDLMYMNIGLSVSASTNFSLLTVFSAEE